MRTVDWQDGRVRMIDQRRLPAEMVIVEYDDYRDVTTAIRDMVVRGAPAIGATGAFALALAAQHSAATTRAALLADLADAAVVIRNARPTASNLAWGVDRLLRKADATPGDADAVRAAVLAEAQAIADADVATNRRMGAHGAALVPAGATILHHCNTGALAAVDYGTALGVVRAAHEQGKGIRVLVDETRPRLQGAKLTAWELRELGVPQTVIADNAAGHFLHSGAVNLVLVGADRIAANGDTANKIGTYNLAVLAKENGVPFYVVAPTSTVDLACPDGAAIPIEERDAREVTHVGREQLTPDGVAVANPAFDVTPARYITAIVTDQGVVYPPYTEGLRRAVERAQHEPE